MGRYELLRKADFDPGTDLVLEPSGLYAWRAPQSALATNTCYYFQRRAVAENN
jgi:hypothetical protein